MYAIQQRIPNFVEHRPEDCECALIDHLEEIHNLEFIKFRQEECKEVIILIPVAPDDWSAESKWQWYIFATPPYEFENRAWIGWVREIKSLKDISVEEYNNFQTRITMWKNAKAERDIAIQKGFLPRMTGGDAGNP